MGSPGGVQSRAQQVITSRDALEHLPTARRGIQLRTELTEELAADQGAEVAAARRPHQFIFNAVDAMPEGTLTLRNPPLTSASRALTMSRAMGAGVRRYRHRHGRGDPAALS